MIMKLLYLRFRAVSERVCKEQIDCKKQRAKKLEKWRTYQTAIVREF